jgi:hypothetical protein
MIIIPHKHSAEQDNEEMTSLIDPDNTGPWAIRYLWIRNLNDNETFYNNYFDPTLAQAGMNIRKQSADLTNDWTAHNQIFFDSAKNGNLVWRVKVGNPINKSIDYIEIWRSQEIVKSFFGDSPTVTINDNITWTNDSRVSFLEQLRDKGFDIREWTEFPTISKIQAMQYYKKFVDQWENKDSCIINTPWSRVLNPYL